MTEQVSVTSNKPIGVLTPDQRKKRVDDLRSRMGRSRLEVEGDPAMHYFWAPKDDSGELIRLEILGYRIVREPSPKEVLAGKVTPKIRANGLREDGTYIIGDTILTEVEKDVYEILMEEPTRLNDAMKAAATEDFKNEAAKQGVPTFETGRRR